MSYEAWRISFQSSEQAARAAYEQRTELLEALQAAVNCGLVPFSSTRHPGDARHSIQVRVADHIHAVIAKTTGAPKP
jgi:hypothetical protein